MLKILALFPFSVERGQVERTTQAHADFIRSTSTRLMAVRAWFQTKIWTKICLKMCLLFFEKLLKSPSSVRPDHGPRQAGNLCKGRQQENLQGGQRKKDRKIAKK